MSGMAYDPIPVFVINGFLEAGKTQFMKFTMQQDYFYTDGRTLLILCEEGEEEYEDEFLKKYNTDKIIVDNIEDINIEFLELMNKKFHPERVLIEWNGIWKQDELELPKEWFLNQMVTIFDTSTLDLYLKNMKPLMGPMLKDTELIICNRADDIEEKVLANYHLLLRAMSPDSEIIFEGEEGEIRGDFSIELPYDLEAKKVIIKPEDYGIFFVDSMDRFEKYDGKIVEFSAQVAKPKGLGENFFVPGRKAMTCCEDDMRFLGLICHYEGIKNYENRDWVKVTAKIKVEENKAYRGVGPVLYAIELVRTGPINEVVEF